MPVERWLPVVGAEGEYEVSDFGRVRSLDRIVADNNGGRVRWFVGRVLKPGPADGCGHLAVMLGADRREQVHVLVLSAFVGLRPARMECRHLDGNPANNKLSNLVWGTRADNIRDVKYHRAAPGYHKLTPQDVVGIRKQTERGLTQTEVAALFGVSQSTVSLIKLGRVHGDVP